jgi:hypothetical protein
LRKAQRRRVTHLWQNVRSSDQQTAEKSGSAYHAVATQPTQPPGWSFPTVFRTDGDPGFIVGASIFAVGLGPATDGSGRRRCPGGCHRLPRGLPRYRMHCQEPDGSSPPPKVHGIEPFPKSAALPGQWPVSWGRSVVTVSQSSISKQIGLHHGEGQHGFRESAEFLANPHLSDEGPPPGAASRDAFSVWWYEVLPRSRRRIGGRPKKFSASRCPSRKHPRRKNGPPTHRRHRGRNVSRTFTRTA